MRALALCFVVLTVCAASSAARADESRLAAMRREVFAPLNLTDQQKMQLKALHREHEAEVQALRAQVRDAGHGVTSGLTGSASDAQLTALHQKLEAARTALADTRFRGLLAVRQVLTPEQRTQFNQLFITFLHNHRGRPLQ